MLLVKIVNDGTVKHPKGNYTYEVLVTKVSEEEGNKVYLEVIAKGHIKDFDRRKGWKSLVRKVAGEPSDFLNTMTMDEALMISEGIMPTRSVKSDAPTVISSDTRKCGNVAQW